MMTFLAAGGDEQITVIIVFTVFAVILIATAIIFIYDVRGMVKRYRAERGRCPSCDYDLRGTTHEKCPECGQALR